MSSDNPHREPEMPEYVEAEARVEAAISRLDASLRSLNGRVRSLGRIETDVRQLEIDRARLSSELQNANQRAKRLDDASGEVSRRLVHAMEHVRAIASLEDATNLEDKENA